MGALKRFVAAVSAAHAAIEQPPNATAAERESAARAVPTRTQMIFGNCMPLALIIAAATLVIGFALGVAAAKHWH